MINQKKTFRYVVFLILLFLFSSESKAIALATLPSTLSDTCVEISLKSGSKISAKITKKTTDKIYFRKCDNLADTTSYFVLQEKIDNIKNYNEKNENKQRLIWILVIISLLFLILSIAGILSGSILFFSRTGLVFSISSILGLIALFSYKGNFEGKEAAKGILLGVASLIVAFIFLLALEKYW